ncbi:MAG TPA: YciE/YciF family protein [Pantoea sp.]|nr:YciE/YciF family protein [Pantoea sp.]
MTKDFVYLDWLRDAHAMEKHAEAMLQGAALRLDDFPLLKARIEQYRHQTQQQHQQVKDVLKRYDTNWSALKDALGRMSAVGQAASDMLRDEEGVRIAVSSYVFCNYKVATYTALLAAAQQAQDSKGVKTFLRILQQETQMADWLLTQLPDVANEAIMHRTEADISSAI